MASGRRLRPRAVRGRARARGPAPRRGRDARRLGPVRRVGIIALAVVLVAAALYLSRPPRQDGFADRDRSEAGRGDRGRIGRTRRRLLGPGPLDHARPRRRVVAAAARDRTAEERPGRGPAVAAGPDPRRGAGRAAAVIWRTPRTGNRGSASSSARESKSGSGTRPRRIGSGARPPRCSPIRPRKRSITSMCRHRKGPLYTVPGTFCRPSNKPSTEGSDWPNPQVMLETFRLQDASRRFDRGPRMPYVERNFRGSVDGWNP